MEARRVAQKLTQAELAHAAGLTQGAIGHLEAGRSAGSRKLHEIAAALKTTPAYLEGRIDDPDLGATPPPSIEIAADQLDAVMIKEIDVEYSMGGGSVIEDLPAERVVPISRSWLQGMTRSTPDKIVVARGRGDSMQPTILDGDLCLIDLAENTMRGQDRVWALAYGGFRMIKRVRQHADGALQINSDNAAVSPIQAYDGEAFLVGRVIGVLRRI